MMCHSRGRSPTSTIGLGRYSVSSRMRVPIPPHSTTTFGMSEGVISRVVGVPRMFLEPRSGGAPGGGRHVEPEALQLLHGVGEMGLFQAGVAADPERPLGDDVGRLQRPDDAMLDVLVGRLAQEVA